MPAIAPIEEVDLPWNELIQVLHEGILGKTGLTQKQIVSSCIVDPAGLQFIQHSSPGKAGGASRAIYQLIKIRDRMSFPAPVRKAVTAVGHATYHRYYKYHVIHVVGPDLREQSHWDEALAKRLLSEAYYIQRCDSLAANGATSLKNPADIIGNLRGEA